MPCTTCPSGPCSMKDAYDVAAYILSMKRPVMADLDKDFPIRLQKPVDTPYAPYADGFSLEQHTLGPFSPIRARLQELAAQSSVEKPGGPDNGSNEADRRKCARPAHRCLMRYATNSDAGLHGNLPAAAGIAVAGDVLRIVDCRPRRAVTIGRSARPEGSDSSRLSPMRWQVDRHAPEARRVRPQSPPSRGRDCSRE